MTTLRVIFTVPWARRAGGAENILWSYFRHVDRTRVEPLVVFFENGPFEREVAALGIETSVIEAGRLRQPVRFARTVRGLASMLRSERPDLLVDWSAKTHLYGAPAAALARMSSRVIWWQQGTPTGDWIDRVATRLPACAIGSYSTAAAEAQRRIRPSRRVEVVPPGIEPPPTADRATLDRLRASLALPPDRTIVGVVGRMEPGKRHDVVIEAVGTLAERGHDLHCLVVGGTAFGRSPEQEPALHALVDRLGLRDRVTFTGQVDDARPYIQLMDVLASASESESFGIVLVEALALGVAVVAFDAGGPAEIIEDGVSGILVRDPGVAAMTSALEGVMQDDLRRRLATAGKERFDAQLTARQWSQRMTSTIEKLSAASRPSEADRAR